MIRRLVLALAALAFLSGCGASDPVARAANDSNGDGLADIAIGLPHAVVVVLGRRDVAAVTPTRLAPGTGFVIRSRRQVEFDGWLGDVDGDGLADLHLGTWDPKTERGTDYFVFGRHETTDLDLDRGGPDIQRLPWPQAFQWPLGDLNGDGVGDLAFGGDQDLDVTVVFGRRDRAPITRALLRSPGERGFIIKHGPWAVGFDVLASAGDANGDGLGDLVIAPRNYRYCGEGGSGCGGQPFVIYGRRRPGTVVLTGSYRSGQFAVREGSRSAGYHVDAISGYRNVLANGDFDGDGLDDLFVTGWEYGQGTAIVFGRRAPRTTVQANPPRSRDVVLIRNTQSFGRGGGPLGDVNGDGLSDVLVTAPVIDRQGDRIDSLTVLFGRRERVTLNARRPGALGWRIAVPSDLRVEWSGPLGDVNGDGLADFAVAAYTDESLDQPAHTYVILGTRSSAPTRVDALGAGGFVIG